MQRLFRFGVADRQMKLPGTRLATRRLALSPLALCGLLALAGCAGGGGGPASNVIPALSYNYPSSLLTTTFSNPVGGSMAPYALDPTTPSLDSVASTVLGAEASNGQLTITVSSISLPSGGSEPSFVVTFDPVTTTGLTLLNSPLDGIGCSGCIKTATAPAKYVSSGALAGTVSFTYLDPSSANFPLNYSTLGMWTKGSKISSSWPEIGGAFSGGVLTRGIDLPTTGTASYNGYFFGTYVTSDTSSTTLPTPGTYLVGANAQAQVNFSGDGAITFSTSNTNISKELTPGVTSGGLALPSAEPSLNLSTTTPMTITRTITSNSFKGGPGTLTNAMGMGATGEITGQFYGPPASTAPYAPPEMGGSLAVNNSSNTQSMVGSFALKR